VLEGAPYVFAAGDREELLQELRESRRAVLRRDPRGDLTGFFKQAGALFHQLWLDYTVFRPPPMVHTADGDPVEPATAIFDVRDGVAVPHALAGHPDLERQDDGSYVWTDPAPAPDDAGEPIESPSGGFGDDPRHLGTIVLDGESLRLEVVSRARAVRGRGFLEGLLGRAVVFREVTYRDVDEAVEGPAVDEVPPEVQAELTVRFLDAHYRSWPDTVLPALGHRTPREAAGSDDERPTLITLLKDMESRAERAHRRGQPAYDLAWLWAELGIPRPE
jgi:hypothetical protein